MCCLCLSGSSVAGSMKPHRRTKSESDVKRKLSSSHREGSGSESKKPKIEKRRSSAEDPPNDKKPPEVWRGQGRERAGEGEGRIERGCGMVGRGWDRERAG